MAFFRASGDPRIDGILHGFGLDVPVALHVTPVGLEPGPIGGGITYGFPTMVGSYQYSVQNFAPLNAQQIAVVLEILGQVENVTNLRFVRDWTPDNNADGSPTLRFGEATAVSLNDTDFTDPGEPLDSARAFFPGTNRPVDSDVWLNPSYYNNPVAGNFAYAAGVMHEIGHALGLKHPHDTATGNVMFADGTSATFTRPALAKNLDSLEFTVMSYNSYVGHDGSVTKEFAKGAQFPQSLMMLDIAALQYMYGADFVTNSGDSIYTFDPANGRMLINGLAQQAVVGSFIFRTIWDGGGTDTYDFSKYTTNLQVNLNPGEWTNLGTQLAVLERDDAGNVTQRARGNIANALLYEGDQRSLIENAKGGAGHDKIIGNVADNVLFGNAGRDTLEGGDGDDRLIGGSHGDYMNGGAGDDIYYVDDLDDVVSERKEFVRIDEPISFDAGGDDTVETTLQQYTLEQNLFWAIENLTFTGIGMFRGTGNSVDNRITGSFSSDTLRGLAGDDTLDGRSGADRMEGGLDDDTYFIDNAGDIVNELVLVKSDQLYFSSLNFVDAGSTNDTVVTSLASYDLSNIWSAPVLGALPPKAIFGIVENLTMTGRGGINEGVGNGANNIIAAAPTWTLFPSIDEAQYRFFGLGGQDTLTGGFALAGDTLDGGADDDVLNGLGGNDLLRGGGGTDAIHGDADFDTALFSGNRIDYTIAGSADEFTVTDRVALRDGTDTVYGVEFVQFADGLVAVGELIVAPPAGQSFEGTAYWGVVFPGGAGVDTVSYATANHGIFVDLVRGYAEGGGQSAQLASIENVTGAPDFSNDLQGDAHDNVLIGGSAIDWLRGRGGSNTIDGGGSVDVMDYLDGFDQAVTVDLSIGKAFHSTGIDTLINVEQFRLTNYDDTFIGSEQTDYVMGMMGNDHLVGNGGIDSFDGGLGDDRQEGGAGGDYLIDSYGNDLLLGEDGDDFLCGGMDADMLVGGEGADRFVFYSAAEGGDFIQDFTSGVDRVALSSYHFGFAGTGTLAQAGVDFVQGSAATGVGPALIFDDGADTLYFDQDGAGGAEQTLLAQFALPGTTLQESDFWVM